MRRQATFARTGVPGLFGKYDTTLPAMKFYDDAKRILEQQATEQHIDLTTFIRELCLERAYGAEHLAKVHKRRIYAVAGKLAECEE